MVFKNLVFASLSYRNIVFNGNNGFLNRPVLGSLHLSKNVQWFSNYSSNLATYEEVKRACYKQEQVLVIDVREPDELKETGVLPNSINIPVGDVEQVLKCTSDDEFRKKFGRPKPAKHSDIIFSCKAGIRSEIALNIAKDLGYKRVKHFLGGWTEWEDKLKEQNK